MTDPLQPPVEFTAVEFENGQMSNDNVSRASALGIHTAYRTVKITTGSGKYPDIGYKTELIFPIF